MLLRHWHETITYLLRHDASTDAIFFFRQLPHVQIQCCFTSTETIRTIRDGEIRTATSTSTQLLSSLCFYCSVLLYVHREHTDYERRELRTATSTFTQLLSSECMVCSPFKETQITKVSCRRLYHTCGVSLSFSPSQ